MSVNDSSELANRAIKYLSGNDDKAIKVAVLYACTELPDLVPDEVINDAVARIKASLARVGGYHVTSRG